MSTQHYAYTVIGVRLPAEKLFPDRITNKRPNVYVGLVVGNVRGQEYATRHDISFDDA